MSQHSIEASWRACTGYRKVWRIQLHVGSCFCLGIKNNDNVGLIGFWHQWSWRRIYAVEIGVRQPGKPYDALRLDRGRRRDVTFHTGRVVRAERHDIATFKANSKLLSFRGPAD